jgi:hypothetical protein
MPINPVGPRQCAAFSTAGEGLCLRDTYDVIEMGLANGPTGWEVVVEVPVCDEHEELKTAVSEEANPVMGQHVGDLDDSTTVMPTFRISVFGNQA